MRPGHPELELLDDAGDHADGEVNQEQLAVEAGEAVVFGLLRLVERRLEDGDKEGESDRQGDEEEVEDGRHAELPTREDQG